MISSEVQRTLVKSPPELWAELGDPASLARHLGELGEIRITRAEPEKLVEWEAEAVTGTVAMKASGWGTKVTLTASRELARVEADAPHTEMPPQTIADTAAGETEPAKPPEASEPEPADAPLAPEPAPSGIDAWSRQEAEVAVTAAERFGHEHPATLLGSDLQRAADRELEAEAPQAEPEASEPEMIAEGILPEPEPEATASRRGFFARLFGQGRKRQASAEAVTVDPVAAQQPALEDEPTPAEHPGVEAVEPGQPDGEPAALSESPTEIEEASSPVEEPPAEAALPEITAEPLPEIAAELLPEITAELRAAEEAAEEEVTEILKGVLDRLGAAHHRPFSRS